MVVAMIIMCVILIFLFVLCLTIHNKLIDLQDQTHNLYYMINKHDIEKPPEPEPVKKPLPEDKVPTVFTYVDDILSGKAELGDLDDK